MASRDRFACFAALVASVVGCGPSFTVRDLDAMHDSCAQAGPSARKPRSMGHYAGAAADAPVIVYGASWCEPCHITAAYLERQRIPFVSKDVEEDPASAAAAKSALDRAGLGDRPGAIPVVDVRGTVIIGFAPCAIESAWASRS